MKLSLGLLFITAVSAVPQKNFEVPPGGSGQLFPPKNFEVPPGGSGRLFPPRSVQAELPKPTNYCSTVLYHTNLHRLNHSAPIVRYSEKMANYAGTNIKNCQPNPAELVGSNYAEYWGTGPQPFDAANATVRAIHDWYEPEQIIYASASKDYTQYPDHASFLEWGHFSQMVWTNETKIGCWAQMCAPDTPFAKQFGKVDWSWAVVCASSPAGNTGDYNGCVKPSIGHEPSDYSIQNNNSC